MLGTRVPVVLFMCLLLPNVFPAEGLLTVTGEAGRRGGRLVVAQRAEPKTLNPLTAIDSASREVIGRMMADLIHINRATHRTEPALAKSWTVSADGRRYVLTLRRGLRFSDGHPFDADDVLFSFRAYLDEAVHSPQRGLLMVGGKPIAVSKRDSHTVCFDLAQPYAAAERLFDSVAILPQHLLQKAYEQRTLGNAWSLNTAPAGIAGLGPFRLKEYVAGQRIVLERNPYYWKADRGGTRLPYLDALVFLFVAGEDGQVVRFESGETGVISRMGARNFAVLEKEQQARGFRLQDLGPGLEYNFLFFNMNDAKALPRNSARQAWFRDVRFRQAVSSAIDREGIVRLVYSGRATPLWGHVTPGNRLWMDRRLPHPPRSLDQAHELLKTAGFHRNREGLLTDTNGRAVEFSIVVAANNPERIEIATIVQDDLRQLGMTVRVVPLEFRAMLDRLFRSFDYDACVLGLGSGDVDPTSEMNVWMSNGGTHLWHLNETRPATPWEAEIDRLMEQQQTTRRYADRKRLYDRVQELAARYLPLICLVSPNILVGAKTGLGNFHPAILDHYTLWNVEELFWGAGQLAARQ